MFKILGLLFLGLCVGYASRNANTFKGIEKYIPYTIFTMLLLFGITIGANRTLLNNIGQFGVQAVILASCGVVGSLVAAFFASKLFMKKGGRQHEN